MIVRIHSPQETTDTTATTDTTRSDPSSTAYDTIWTEKDVPTQQPAPIERVMLAEDKLYVVLAVVLVIWFGLLLVLFRTNSRIRRLEEEGDQS